MIVTSGALVLVALVLLVMGVLGADLPFVYASIAVSTLSLLCLLVGILQRRGEPLPDGDDLVPVQVPAGTSVRTGSAAVADRPDDPAPTTTLSQDLLSRGRAGDAQADAGTAQEQGWQGDLTDDVAPHEDRGDQYDQHDVYEDDEDPYEDHPDVEQPVEEEASEDEGSADEASEDAGPPQGGVRLVRVPQSQPQPQAQAKAEPEPDAAEDDDARSAGTVLVVSGRPRYHAEGCRYLYGKQPQEVDAAEARDSGFVACGVCKPDAVLAAHDTAAEDTVAEREPQHGEQPEPPAVGGPEPQQQEDEPQVDEPQERDGLSLEETLFGEAVFGEAAGVGRDATSDDGPADGAEVEPSAAEQVPIGPAPAGAPTGEAPAKAAENKAPAKKAPAKKAPAGKAPAGKAPASKAPASKAPASEAPAKKAPATEASAADAAPRPAPASTAPAPTAPVVRRIRASGAAPARPAVGVPTVRRVSARGAARPTDPAAPPARTPATAGPSREATPGRRAGQVVVIPDRPRFHRAQCRFVRDVPAATALSRAAADRQGYQPCGVCKP